jgi:hypothetical protein
VEKEHFQVTRARAIFRHTGYWDFRNPEDKGLGLLGMKNSERIRAVDLRFGSQPLISAKSGRAFSVFQIPGSPRSKDCLASGKPKMRKPESYRGIAWDVESWCIHRHFRVRNFGSSEDKGLGTSSIETLKSRNTKSRGKVILGGESRGVIFWDTRIRHFGNPKE